MLSIRWACSGVFGSPKAVIFFMALASSGFERSSALIDAFWNQRLKIGTFERNVTIGRRYRPPRKRPRNTSSPIRTATTIRMISGSQAHHGIAGRW